MSLKFYINYKAHQKLITLENQTDHILEILNLVFVLFIEINSIILEPGRQLKRYRQFLASLMTQSDP